MIRCGNCASELPESSRFCLSCGSSVSNGRVSDNEATVAMASSPRYVTPQPQDMRFVPGTLLAGRYRVVSRLGKGGMGEVFRADDIILGEPVALKFLPEATANNPTALARFYDEVRIARQVTHPNVCRVFDIGDIGGQPYISMRYIDGEDLAALLRRIGRLPGDKALEFARKLCAGLAAAHAQGVLHRDFKPANIMIDSQGQVVITDFGLAGIAGQVEGAEVRNGTPAYMAPEQLTGTEVSAKSDIYALGLVLYEMFTGKPPFEAATLAEMVRLRKESTPKSVTSVAPDVDQLVERVILRCLDSDPRNRPASALAVAAALPGGDPLAAALAAGETPSPEMVAAAGETEGLQLPRALAALAAVTAGLLIVGFAASKLSLINKLPFDNSPDVLAAKAHETIVKLGYADRPADRAYGFEYLWEYLNYSRAHTSSFEEWERILRLPPYGVFFWYRQSPYDLNAQNNQRNSSVSYSDPPLNVPGMVNVSLDLEGRLLGLRVVPPLDEKPLATPPTVDWTQLFTASGLDQSRFKPVEPERAPLAPIDARAAWTGSTTDRKDAPIRIEAAAWRGKPVYFQITGPWTGAGGLPGSLARQIGETLQTIVMIGAFIAAFIMVRGNLACLRGDIRGALAVVGVGLVLGLLAWILVAHHITDAGFRQGMGNSLFGAAMLFALYLALEPQARRHWPQTLITWSRVMTGRYRDPLVGRDLLLGAVFGIGYSLLEQAYQFTMSRLGSAPTTDFWPGLLGGILVPASSLTTHVFDAIQETFFFFLVIFLLRAVLRNQWLAAAGFVLIYALIKSPESPLPLVAAPFQAVVYGLVVVILIRYGLLAMMTTILVTDLLANFMFTWDFRAWYGTTSLLAVVVVLGIAWYGFRTSLRTGSPAHAR